VAQIAKRMGYSGFDWKDEWEIYDEVRAKTKGSFTSDLSEISRSMLERAGSSGVQFPMKNRHSISRLYSEETEKYMGRRFAHRDGKAHLEHVKVLAEFDPYKHPLRQRVNSEYPFWMIMHRPNEVWNTGYNFYNNGRNIPLVQNLYERVAEQTVSINPQDAIRLGIRTGDWIKITSRQGSLKAVAKVHELTRPGVVDVMSLYPKSESTPNMVTSEVADPKLGEWDRMVPVRITKI